MKFFLDTANIKEIREGQQMGVLDGVTTNPSLVAKEGRAFKETVLEICEVVQGPVSVEVTATDLEGMLEQGRAYAKWNRHVVVKLPTTREGVKSCKALTQEGIKVNMTLCFSATQALLVAKAGATYVSPFVGRLDDISSNGITLVQEIVHIYKNYAYSTQVLAASLRHPMHVVEAALAGAHVGTMPFKVLEMMFHHPLTDLGLEKFAKDWEKANLKDLEKAMK
ncbi:MAG: fructose-6-phosphate aldolase [Acidobacteria bacterium]|nr:fructose-6-phosphate aldolase [Acidobacteriota bacterium]MBV9145802.1 fructose-6-phosphate aldolase [Acidobacteriota bacterium]MBV9434422.1 fructose-6-phosphate aldolase [Acidobacteriota bacterium]